MTVMAVIHREGSLSLALPPEKLLRSLPGCAEGQMHAFWSTTCLPSARKWRAHGLGVLGESPVSGRGLHPCCYSSSKGAERCE